MVDIGINPFQAGQLFSVTKAQERQKLIAQERRETGINALAAQFGPGALAPTEFAAVTGAERQERVFQANLAQRDITNQRLENIDKANAAQREITNEDIDRKFEADVNQLKILNERNNIKFAADEDQRATANALAEKQFISLQATRDAAAQVINDKRDFRMSKAAVAFVKQGLEAKQPPAEIVRRLTPALLQLGYSEEQIGELPNLLKDPNFINELDAALDAAFTTTNKRVITALRTENADGTFGFTKLFSDGTTEPVEGVTDSRASQSQQRVINQAANVQTKRDIITPSLAEPLAQAKARGAVVGKGLGARIVEDLPTSRTEIASQRAKIRSAAATTDRAINALDSAVGQISTASTGFIGGVTAFIPGTPGFKLVKKLLPALAQEFVTNLQNMRDLSKTGGAVGNVSNAEGDKLQGVNAVLDIGVGKVQLLEQIQIMRDAILESRRNVERAFQEDQEARAAALRSKPRSTDIEALLDKFAPLEGQ